MAGSTDCTGQLNTATKKLKNVPHYTQAERKDMRLAIKPLPDVISLFFSGWSLDENEVKTNENLVRLLPLCREVGRRESGNIGRRRKTHIFLQLIFDQRDGLKKGEIRPGNENCSKLQKHLPLEKKRQGWHEIAMSRTHLVRWTNENSVSAQVRGVKKGVKSETLEIVFFCGPVITRQEL